MCWGMRSPMSSSKHLGIAVLVMFLLAGLGEFLFVWPAYSDAADLDARTADLRVKGQNYTALSDMIQKLKAEVAQATQHVKTDLKQIPDSPDVAGLIGILSMPREETTVRDQTFTAGQPKEAAPGTDVSVLARPLTVEMVARFDAIFALIRTAESMDRLVRVTSLELVCKRNKDQGEPFAKVSVVLEAIFDPPQTDEDP